MAANAGDAYRPLNRGEAEGGEEQVHPRRNDYHLLPQIRRRNQNNAPEPNRFDDISLLALTTSLSFGLAALHASNDKLDVIGSVNLTGTFMIVFSNIMLARTYPRVAYVMDRSGVALVFGSLFYASAPLFFPYLGF